MADHYKIQRKVDSWSGRGELLRDGASLGTYPYVIDVHQEFFVVPKGRPFGPPVEKEEEVSGLKSMSGRLLATEGLNLFDLEVSGGQFTLRLEDGREVDVLGFGSFGELHLSGEPRKAR